MGSMEAQEIGTKSLMEHVRPYAADIDENFQVDDDFRLHRAMLVDSYEWIRRNEGILKSHSLSSLLNFLRAFGDGPVAGVPGGQVSNHGWHDSSSSPVPQKTRRVGQRCTLNLSRAEMYSRWSITKSPRVAEQCDVNIHSLGDGPRNFKPWSNDEDEA
ncbi:hypothetical protein TNCV_2892231 [Trichonephila clavipes]|nr:hypothetical protein TNCV_2892231 [Trichonephila clavipes]